MSSQSFSVCVGFNVAFYKERGKNKKNVIFSFISHEEKKKLKWKRTHISGVSSYTQFFNTHSL